VEEFVFAKVTTGTVIKIIKGEDNIYVDDQRFSINEPKVRDFIFRVAQNHPNPATFKLLLDGHSGGDEDAKEANVVRHKVRTLLRARGTNDFIDSVRGVGYRISEEWQARDASGESLPNNLIIKELRELVEEGIRKSQTKDLNLDVSGLSYIKPNSEESLDTFRKFNRLYWELLEVTTKAGNSLEIINLRRPFFELATYFFFWRAGDNLSDVKWRADYEREIRLILKQFEQAYEDI